MDFSKALLALKAGKRITRLGWNGKDMFAVYSPGNKDLPAERFWSKPLEEYAAANGGNLTVRPSLMLKTAQNDVAYWVPSCSDILAEDWVVLH